MFEINPDVVAIFIPILVVIGFFAAVIVAIFTRGKRKELMHRERLAAMEKGIPIPEEPVKQKRPVYLKLRTWGIVLILLGVVLFFAIGFETKGAGYGFYHGLWGLIPFMIGAGLLISANLEKRDSG
jgi:hypothetical protein